MTLALVDPKVLAALIDYNTDTGVMIWRERGPDVAGGVGYSVQWNGRYAGQPALAHQMPSGYLTGCVLGVAVRAHRVAWAIANGAWPVGEIDHINGIRTDNRLSNLRDVPKEINGRNQKLHVTNTSGVAGVSFKKDKGLWRARIRIDGRMKTVGTYASFDRAVEARRRAESDLGYHQNHGGIR